MSYTPFKQEVKQQKTYQEILKEGNMKKDILKCLNDLQNVVTSTMQEIESIDECDEDFQERIVIKILKMHRKLSGLL